MKRPKYYVVRSFLIYFLTILTGTLISSLILSYFQPLGSASLFAEDLMAYFIIGLMITAVICIPILFILIFGFYRIYSGYDNEKQKWLELRGLSLISISLPLVITFMMAVANFSGWANLSPWILVMLAYASSGVFFILYISHRADSRNPPGVITSQDDPGLDDILDSGFGADFQNTHSSR